MGQLPSPITGTDLIYLFWLKKKEQKQLCIAFGLSHKRNSPRACLRVLLFCPPSEETHRGLPTLPGKQLLTAWPCIMGEGCACAPAS